MKSEQALLLFSLRLRGHALVQIAISKQGVTTRRQASSRRQNCVKIETVNGRKSVLPRLAIVIRTTNG